MKGIVLYKSKYGHSKQYATWIAEDLGFELKAFKAFKQKDVKAYDTVIFGTGVYMGKMNGLKRALNVFKNKPITIFASAGNPGLEEEINVIKQENFTPDELAFHHFFYLPGGVDFTIVKGPMKLLIGLYHIILKRKKVLTRDEQGILNSYDQPTNYVDKKHIKALVESIKKS